jgi:hypothetical protein
VLLFLNHENATHRCNQAAHARWSADKQQPHECNITQQRSPDITLMLLNLEFMGTREQYYCYCSNKKFAGNKKARHITIETHPHERVGVVIGIHHPRVWRFPIPRCCVQHNWRTLTFHQQHRDEAEGGKPSQEPQASHPGQQVACFSEKQQRAKLGYRYLTVFDQGAC